MNRDLTRKIRIKRGYIQIALYKVYVQNTQGDQSPCYGENKCNLRNPRHVAWLQQIIPKIENISNTIIMRQKPKRM